MTDVQAYYSRIASRARNNLNVISACAYPSIDDPDQQRYVGNILKKCSIGIQEKDDVITCINDARAKTAAASSPQDIGKDAGEVAFESYLATIIASPDEADEDDAEIIDRIFSDARCSAYESSLTDQDVDAQRYTDLQKRIRIEQRNLFFRIVGIIGIGVTSIFI
jgi:hypothetical protein